MIEGREMVEQRGGAVTTPLATSSDCTRSVAEGQRKTTIHSARAGEIPLEFCPNFCYGNGMRWRPGRRRRRTYFFSHGTHMYRNFSIVPKIMFGRGSFNQLGDILAERRTSADSYLVFVLDDVFLGKPLQSRLPLQDGDLLLPVNVDDEPKTSYIDSLVGKFASIASSSRWALSASAVAAPWISPRRCR
jgi:hypothetical protein